MLVISRQVVSVRFTVISLQFLRQSQDNEKLKLKLKLKVKYFQVTP